MSGRFVVQHHQQAAGAHWDLMFEEGADLATWRSPCALADIGGVPVAIERIGAHRLAYLEYEGPISGDRGSVRIVERGTFTWRMKAESQWGIAVESDAGERRYRLWRCGPLEQDWCIAREADR